MDYVKLFYWITVADNATLFFGWGVAIFMILFFIVIICHFIIGLSDNYPESEEGIKERKDDLKIARKYLFLFTPFVVIFWLLYIFTPSKKDSILIIAGGETFNYLTTDSVAKQIPHELSSYLVTEIRNQAERAEVELKENKTKENVLTEVRGMNLNQIKDYVDKNPEYKDMIYDFLGLKN